MNARLYLKMGLIPIAEPTLWGLLTIAVRYLFRKRKCESVAVYPSRSWPEDSAMKRSNPSTAPVPKPKVAWIFC
jgi:hypothetical protein